MNLKEKISEFKSICRELIDCYKKIDDAIENPTPYLEELHINSLKLLESLNACSAEIERIRKEQIK